MSDDANVQELLKMKAKLDAWFALPESDRHIANGVIPTAEWAQALNDVVLGLVRRLS